MSNVTGSPEVIAALAAGIAGIIGAIFNGIALLRHTSNPDAHADTAPAEPGKPANTP